jgi:hypothetical protein
MTRQEVKARNEVFIAKAIRDAGWIHRSELEPVPDQWQPIETAPKDGTNIDIWIGRERRTDVRWRMSQDSPNRVWWCELAFDDWKDRWIWSNLAQEFSVSPTHWMPMPSPPTEELGE